jgi:5-methylthioadenosine/S-adenosylhomocysteine deaminase
MSRYIIKGAKVLTLNDENPIIDDGAVIVNGHDIEAVGRAHDLSRGRSFDAELGGRQCVVMPGFSNAHYHCGPGSTVRVGARDDRLEVWRIAILGALMSPRSDSSAQQALYAATQYYACGMIRSGITSCLDFVHVQPGMSDYGIGTVAKAYDDLGFRASIAAGATNQCGYVYESDETFLSSLPRPLSEQVASLPFARSYVDEDDYVSVVKTAHARYDGSGNGRIRIFLSPYAPQWASDSLMTKIKETAQDLKTGIQLHLLETRHQMQYALRTYGKTAVAHLHDLGILGKEVSCAHAIWINDSDIDLLRETETVCVHNPLSNLRLGSGIARVVDLIDANVRVAIGTDGMGFSADNDMLNQVRLADYLQRLPLSEREFMSPIQWLRLATLGGAQVIGLGKHWGTLDAGKKADMLVIDTNRISDTGMDLNAIDQILLQYATPDDIQTVIIDGKVVMDQGRLLTADEANLRQFLRSEFATMSEHFKAKLPLVRELESHVRRHLKTWSDEGSLPAYQYNVR